ncbi:MAG: hypothetical protein O7F73_15230 [Gammaproteobacteria bacterium]|nr:hypothetical protein [Gammaproteobacteria bacterium]
MTVHTSEPDWLRRVADAYRQRHSVVIIDDAGVGIDPGNQSLLEMGRTAGLSRQEWASVLISLGLSGAGIWMVIVAIVSPEPTSKLGLLVVGGSVLIFSGGFSAIRILTDRRPPTVEVTPRGIRLTWE